MSSSAELYARALKVIPGGVNSPVRAMQAVGRDPLFIERGAGALLWDVEGHGYIDWVCSWGPLIAGHAHPAVLEAVARAAARGTSFGASTEVEVQLAEEVSQRVPGAEMVRMTSTGTEAAMTAVRLARASTGRERILKFSGAYHGHSDGLLAAGGSGLATQGIPSSPGVPEAVAALCSVAAWNDLEAVRAAGPLAAILLEPCPANMGLVPPEDGFLQALRKLADETGALLVFDEVISGFRVARGGAQEHFGVHADLIVLGKVIGGGLPAAAVAGPRRVLEQLAPAGQVYQAGTLSGNPLAVAAGLATLALLDVEAYASLAQNTTVLADGLRDAAAGRPVQVQSVPGLLTVFFSREPVRNMAGASACDHAGYGAFWRGMLKRGVYLPPSQYEAWFPSLAHEPAHIERTLEAASQTFAEIE